jgi:hypothetical protein
MMNLQKSCQRELSLHPPYLPVFRGVLIATSDFWEMQITEAPMVAERTMGVMSPISLLPEGLLQEPVKGDMEDVLGQLTRAAIVFRGNTARGAGFF